MTSQERYSAHAQLEHLQAKYVGTGHSDTTKLCAMPRTRATHGARSCSPLPDLCFESLTAQCTFCPRGRSEWGVNQHRDSLALYVGFDSLTQYIAVAENESVGRVKFNCLQVSDVLASLPQPRPRATLCSRRGMHVRRPSHG